MQLVNYAENSMLDKSEINYGYVGIPTTLSFVTSVVSSISTAINEAALISFFESCLITSSIASFKSFWFLFEKPENADVSKCLAYLSSFSARAR